MTIFAAKPICAALASCILLSACGGSASSLSSANPFNWLGGNKDEQAAVAETQIPADPRHLMPQILDLKIEATSGGVIVRATGLPPVQGWSHADLITQNDGFAVDGVLSFEFRALPPRGYELVSTQASREVTVATFLSNASLAGVRSIQVSGAANGLNARP